MDAAGRLGTLEHQQEVSGEKPEGARRVDERMGTRGPGRGREQVPTSLKGLGRSECACVEGGRQIPRIWLSFINHIQNEQVEICSHIFNINLVYF